MTGARLTPIVSGMDLPEPADVRRSRTFDALLDRRALDHAYRVARIILLDASEAEDATHDAVISAWRRFDQLRDPDRFEAWFGRILVNACRDRLRSRRRLPISIETVPVGSLERQGGPDPGELVGASDAIRAALRHLGPEHREVIALRYQADLTVDQIAERTGARPGTVKSRLHYALRHLRESVDATDHRSTLR